MVDLLVLPRYAVFKNKYNGKYLIYRPADKYLPFKGDDVLSQKSKFAIEPTINGNGLVHVRSCYNNRYLVRNSSGFVVAEAAKPDEDTSSGTCTLFEPIVVDDSGSSDKKLTIRFRHVQSGSYACLYYTLTDPVLDACLCATSNSPHAQLLDAYEVIDWETLVRFPSHSVAFGFRPAGDGVTEKYLGITTTMVPLEFRETDKNAATASFGIKPVGDGSVYIHSNNSNYSKSYICADFNCEVVIAPYVTDLSFMRFWPFKLGGKVVALRNSATNKFLNVNNDCVLRAEKDTITDETHLTVEELFVSKSIYNIVYRQGDARIYDETPIICGYGEDTNDSDQIDTMEIPFSFEDVKITSWNNSASIEAGVSTTFKTGVPFIAEGEIEIDVSASYEHQWGGQKDESVTRGVTYTATIGPRTHVKVSYIATKGTCDVPFSYTEAVTYSDGSSKRYDKDDGLYTGVNCYNYSFVKKETPLR